MTHAELPLVFTAMLRSFVCLGETQNLSLAVSTLGVSRQTIRRHVKELEHIRGAPLFDTNHSQYRLTQTGEVALADAKKVLAISAEWFGGRMLPTDGLLNTEIEIDDHSWVYAQQVPLLNVWSAAPPILQRGMESWVAAQGVLEHEAFEKIRPYVLVYRKYRGEWLIVEVGERSAYNTWLGNEVAKSEIGRPLDLGEKYQPAVAYWRVPYESVLKSGGLWYEHISLSLPRQIGGEPIPVSYQRLVAACCFPDGQPAVMVFAARTDTIDIPQMPSDRLVPNRPENLMEFEI